MRAAEQEAIRYDVDEANRLLDEIGLTDRDGDGYRLTSDDKRLTLEVITGTGLADLVTISELVTNYWREIGVELKFNIIERSLFSLRTNNADFDLTTWIMEPSQLKYRTDSPASGWFLTAGPLGAAVAQLVSVERRVGRGAGRRGQGDARPRARNAQRARRRQVARDGQGVHDDVRRERVRHRHGGLAAAPDDLQKEHHEPVRRAGVDQRDRGQLPRTRLPMVDQRVA